MAEAAMALAALQVVMPVAVAAMPAAWRRIEVALRWVMTRTGRDSSREDTHLVCINTILDTLDRFPDHSWRSDSHIQSLMNQIEIKTESLKKKIENDNAVMRVFRKNKFAKDIQYIAVMMNLLEGNVRVRQTNTSVLQCNANRYVNTNRLDLNFYKESQENLIKGLRTILLADDLKPVVIKTREDYEAITEKSGICPRIHYQFQPERASGYPRTLSVSRGVRECIELLLKRLRDLKLMQETQNSGGSVIIGVALYESFTEILPKVLMDHLVERRLRLLPLTAQQFSKNLSFFRSFSVSSTFKAIQGSDGLQLEEEDKVLNIDLRQSEWVTWESVRKMSLEVGTSSGRITTTPSGHIESHECTLCGVFIAGESVDTELARHWEACVKREERWQRSPQQCCPVCHEDMNQMAEEEKGWHVNACLDRNGSVFYS